MFDYNDADQVHRMRGEVNLNEVSQCRSYNNCDSVKIKQLSGSIWRISVKNILTFSVRTFTTQAVISGCMVALGVIASLAPAAATTINITSAPYNAVGDGITENTAKINQALTDAYNSNPKKDVYVPAGTFAHNGLIYVNGVKLWGAGRTTSILKATNPDQCAVDLSGSGAQLLTLEVCCPSATTRLGAGWQAGVQIRGSNFLVQGINVGDPNTGGGPAGGILSYGGSQGTIEGNYVYNTLADGIHLTNGSNNIGVNANTITNAHDDMIAVVSYLGNSTISQYITISNNTCVSQTWGRGIAVVGGNQIGIYGNTVQSSFDAGMYICSEENGATQSKAASNINIYNNRILNANVGWQTVSHGAIYVYGNPGYVTSNVNIHDNPAVHDVPGLGIQVIQPYVSNIMQSNNNVY